MIEMRRPNSLSHPTTRSDDLIPDLVGGRLPLGRWPATLRDLEFFQSLPDAELRAAMWVEWERLTEAIAAAVGGVAAVWLSGSYFTDKEHPGDIDCLYIIHREKLDAANADRERAAFLQAVAGGEAKPNFGLRVDAYYLDWWPRRGAHMGSEDRRRRYLQTRGYWDDLWSRARDNDSSVAARPRRGYLEVMLDGY